MLGRFFLDHEEKVTSHFSANAAERSEQPAGVDWFIRGSEWPECFLLRRRFHRGERERVIDVVITAIICVTCVCTADTMLSTTIRITTRSGIVERASLISISPSPRVSWSCFCVARQVLLSLMLLTPLNGPTPVLLLLQDDAVLCDVSDSFPVVALHVTAVVPHHRHGDAVVYDWLSVERAQKVVDVHSVYRAPDVVQPKIPPLVAGGPYPLVLGRKGLEDDVFVYFVVYRLPHFLEEILAFVQDEKEVVRLLAGLHLRVND